MTRNSVMVLALSLSLCACGATSGPGHPDQAISPRLDSGVTSSNGGGVRTLGGTNSINIGPGGTTTNPTNQQGRAF